jgi:hypothetical protein
MVLADLAASMHVSALLHQLQTFGSNNNRLDCFLAK